MRELRHREIEEPVEVSEGLQVELRHSCPRVCVLRATPECLIPREECDPGVENGWESLGQETADSQVTGELALQADCGGVKIVVPEGISRSQITANSKACLR